jgi:hypothetical protein
MRKDAENAMGTGCEASLSRRLRPTSIRNSGLVRSNPEILVYREMLLADYYDGVVYSRSAAFEFCDPSSWVIHGRGGPDFVAAIQCDVCQSRNHENHSDNQRHGLTAGICKHELVNTKRTLKLRCVPLLPDAHFFLDHLCQLKNECP